MLPQDRYKLLKGERPPNFWCIQWLIWCWEKPIWLGLPLALPGFAFFWVADIVALLFYLVAHWGGLQPAVERALKEEGKDG